MSNGDDDTDRIVGGFGVLQFAQRLDIAPSFSDPVTTGDAEALAATIRRGLDNAELRNRVGLAGRQRVIERWSWRYCASLTVDQYREVLAMPHNQEKLRRRSAH